MSISGRLEKINEEISAKYDHLMDFYCDNGMEAINGMQYYEEILVEARELFKEGSEATQEEKNAWFEKVKDIEKKK
jgi:hypothetical protein